MDHEEIARLCHEARRSLSAFFGHPPLPAWEDASDADRQSTREGVRASLEDPGLSGEAEWRRWKAAKAAAGWSWGPRKDDGARTHPMLVDDYGLVPPDQRVKDWVGIELPRLLAGR